MIWRKNCRRVGVHKSVGTLYNHSITQISAKSRAHAPPQTSYITELERHLWLPLLLPVRLLGRGRDRRSRWSRLLRLYDRGAVVLGGVAVLPLRGAHRRRRRQLGCCCWQLPSIPSHSLQLTRPRLTPTLTGEGGGATLCRLA